jgi:CxxC-x17-CxxC domain-containing protein
VPYQDQSIECSDCHNPFIFSVRDQEYYAEQGYTNPPKRCRPCRQARKAAFANQGTQQTEGVLFDIICDQCGTASTVPFKPTQGRPVYCFTCHQARQGVNSHVT